MLDPPDQPVAMMDVRMEVETSQHGWSETYKLMIHSKHFSKLSQDFTLVELLVEKESWA